MIRKPLTQIRQIEITSECNLRCKYCPHPKMKRTKAHMEMDVYRRSLEWVRHYVGLGTQGELALTGIGEPLLHPQFVAMLAMAREAMPDGKLLFSTNGIKLCGDEGMAILEDIKPYDPVVYVSTHRPEKAQPAAMNCLRAGVQVGVNTLFVTSAINWAGQVDWEVSAPNTPCGYLGDKLGAIMQSGDITVCCMDAEGVGVIGHVDDEIGSAETGPYQLCNACNYSVPSEYDEAQDNKVSFGG